MIYEAYAYDEETVVVTENGYEFCLVNNYEGHEDAWVRASKIMAALEEYERIQSRSVR